MNKYLKKSIDLANNYDYLDRLYDVYPISLNLKRNINEKLLDNFHTAYENQENKELIKYALKLELFPIKDSYVAFLKYSSLDKNPKTIDRLAEEMYRLGWDKILTNITQPKEANRQMGNKFSQWLNKKSLGLSPIPLEEFNKNENNAILQASDTVAKNFAKEKFGYIREKGLDFIARFNNKYIIGEAKFLTDYGGHQNAQFEDALSTLTSEIHDAIIIAILDGIVYLESNNKMHLNLSSKYKDYNIFSALLLREFCESI